jgi:hypothetical protein
MPNTREIARTEQRITEVDALQQVIEQLQQDLGEYRELLLRQIESFRQEGAIVEPSWDDAGASPDLAHAHVRRVETPAPAAPPQRSPFELDDFDPDKEEKVGGKPVSVLISDGTISEEPLSGWVIDRPAGGLKILVDDEIKVGSVIGVRPAREDPHSQWINVSVKSVRPERQSWVLTCQFVQRPPWQTLALLNG